MMSFLIIHLLLSINANAQTTADLPATQPTSEFGVTTFSIDSTHDFHPECNDVSIGLTAPTLPGQPWYAVSSFDHWGGVGVAFTNAWIDTTTNDIIYESPLSDLVWKSWSITSAGDYSKPFMRVSGTDHCYVNAQIAYLINFNDRTQWKRIGIRANAGASGAHNFIPTDFDFASNAGDVVTANSATCSPTPIDPCDPQCPNTCDPTLSPTVPTLNPTKTPSLSPSKGPTRNPTDFPTTDPTIAPTNDPTIDPTFDPTVDPTFDPTVDPTIDPTNDPTSDPTVDPTRNPTDSSESDDFYDTEDSSDDTEVTGIYDSYDDSGRAEAALLVQNDVDDKWLNHNLDDTNPNYNVTIDVNKFTMLNVSFMVIILCIVNGLWLYSLRSTQLQSTNKHE
eukprot:324201_1